MSGTFEWNMEADGNVGFTLATIGDGVFAPGSPANTALYSAQRISAADGSRRSVRVEDIYINSDVVHDLNLYYRPFSIIPPSAPSSANNDTLIYSYVGRTNTNPFHEDDDSSRRLKTLILGVFGTGTDGGDGGLQFAVPVFGVAINTVKVTVLWSIINPGGGVS